MKNLKRSVLTLDKRIKEHAEILCDWSAEVEEDDKVLISANNQAQELVKALYEEIGKRNAMPITVSSNPEAQSLFLEKTEEFKTPSHLKALYEESDVFINIKSSDNLRALNNVASQKLAKHSKSMKPIQELVEDKRWVLTQHPTKNQAQMAQMSYEEYKDFVYDSIILDWEEIYEKQEKLVKKLEEGKEVKIKGPNTDLAMSIKGTVPKNSCGKKNMPSGEVFTAPVFTSVEGKISFDLPIIYQGKEIENTELKFEKGEVVEFDAEKGKDHLDQILEIDEGSNRVGELGIGTNRGIDKFTKNILFDEKIGNTIHLALGRAIEGTIGDENKRNDSAIHVDMIRNMDNSKLLIDGEEILSEGKFFWEK
ncbi:aminopeptidase [archaeon SCG-AAA382B04]|nr:aminopeptidase [archaeon SCG-AAA382B04]